MGFIPGSTFVNQNMIYHITKINDKNHISIDALKIFDKIQYTFMIKKTLQTRVKGNYLNIVKAYMKSPQLFMYVHMTFIIEKLSF